MQRRSSRLMPKFGLSLSSAFALTLGCATALPDEDPNTDPSGENVAADAGTTIVDAGDGSAGGGSATTPADAGSDEVKADAGTEPLPPEPEPLFDGNFTGSSNWNGQNRLWALVYRAPNAGGHDHVIRSPNFSGSLRYRVGDLSACSVSVTVPVGALINDENEMRADVGLADLSNDGIGWNWINGPEQVRNNMLGASQLDAANHPNITFTSTTCRGNASASGTIYVDGDMTLKGVTRSVTWTVNINANANRVTANGSLSILQSDFGITPYSLLNFKNDDEVELEFEIVVTD